MTRFAAPAQLVSWAGFCPQVTESAGKRKGRNSRKKGNRYIAWALVPAGDIRRPAASAAYSRWAPAP
jgi:transposase